MCVFLFPLTLVVWFCCIDPKACGRNWIHIFGSFLEARYPMRSPCATFYWKMLTMRGGGLRHVKPWGFEMETTTWWWFETDFVTPILGNMIPIWLMCFKWVWLHQLEQVMEVFCSILYWIPNKFHNNHFLEQINSFQTCQPSGVFCICNFRASGIYLLRPYFSVCVVPFKKGDMKTSPVVVDQPWESWNVSTQGQVRSVASTLDVPENLRDQSLKKKLKFVR